MKLNNVLEAKKVNIFRSVRCSNNFGHHCVCIYTALQKFGNALEKWGSLSVGHYELCRDDIGDLPGSPNHLCKEKTPMNIG